MSKTSSKTSMPTRSSTSSSLLRSTGLSFFGVLSRNSGVAGSGPVEGGPDSVHTARSSASKGRKTPLDFGKRYSMLETNTSSRKRVYLERTSNHISFGRNSSFKNYILSDPPNKGVAIITHGFRRTRKFHVTTDQQQTSSTGQHSWKPRNDGLPWCDHQAHSAQ